MTYLVFFLAFLPFLILSCADARADAVDYGNPGMVAPQATLYAQSSGEVYGYFVRGGSASGGWAGDTDTIFLVDQTTGVVSSNYFNNQTMAAGTMVDFGFVNQGDTLIFGLYDQTTGSTGSSVGQYSDDGLNHAYVTNFGGGTLNGASFPQGLYVGMEDRMQGQQWADFNYSDVTFVVTNVAQTPEPETLALLATGVAGGVGFLRRRQCAG